MCKGNLYLFNLCRNQLELWHLLFAENVKTHLRIRTDCAHFIQIYCLMKITMAINVNYYCVTIIRTYLLMAGAWWSTWSSWRLGLIFCRLHGFNLFKNF